jgi:hypothetical protein
MEKTRVTIQEAARILGVCHQRIRQKWDKGYFPNAGWCECHRSIMIPLSDLENEKGKDRRKPDEI